MLIDNTYFIGDINLTAQQLNNIQGYIDVYEKEILVKLLGYPLYKELVDDLNEGEPQTTRFEKLVDGDVFSFKTYQGYTVDAEWNGLRDKAKKKSLIAYYVYFNYVNYNNTQMTTVGNKITMAENAQDADVRMRLVKAWHNMRNWYGKSFKELSYNQAYLDSSNYEHENPEPSAFNYLLAKKEDFNNWVFEPIDSINYLGI
jgi:hypothetical protein